MVPRRDSLKCGGFPSFSLKRTFGFVVRRLAFHSSFRPTSSCVASRFPLRSLRKSACDQLGQAQKKSSVGASPSLLPSSPSLWRLPPGLNHARALPPPSSYHTSVASHGLLHRATNRGSTSRRARALLRRTRRTRLAEAAHEFIGQGAGGSDNSGHIWPRPPAAATSSRTRGDASLQTVGVEDEDPRGLSRCRCRCRAKPPTRL